MGFQLPSCPSSSTTPRGCEDADPSHWVVCMKQSLGPFPGPQEWTWSCWTLSWFRDETQGVWSVLSRCFSMFSRAVYQDADIYLLDDPLSAVDTGVSRHLFEQWVCSYFLSFLLSKNPVEIREESSGKPLCFRRLSSLCPRAPLPLPSLHRRSIVEKSFIMMRSRKENIEGTSSLWRPLGSML